MSHILNINLQEVPLYFAYRRANDGPEHYTRTFHAHQGIEVLIVHEGKGTLIIEQKSYELAPGMLCIFQPYQLHHVQVELSPNTPFIRSIVHFEPTLYESYLDKWPALQAFFKHIHTGSLLEPCIYPSGDAEPLHSLLRSFEQRLPNIAKSEYFEEFSLFLVAFCVPSSSYGRCSLARLPSKACCAGHIRPSEFWNGLMSITRSPCDWSKWQASFISRPIIYPICSRRVRGAAFLTMSPPKSAASDTAPHRIRALHCPHWRRSRHYEQLLLLQNVQDTNGHHAASVSKAIPKRVLSGPTLAGLFKVAADCNRQI